MWQSSNNKAAKAKSNSISRPSAVDSGERKFSLLLDSRRLSLFGWIFISPPIVETGSLWQPFVASIHRRRWCLQWKLFLFFSLFSTSSCLSDCVSTGWLVYQRQPFLVRARLIHALDVSPTRSILLSYFLSMKNEVAWKGSARVNLSTSRNDQKLLKLQVWLTGQ